MNLWGSDLCDVSIVKRMPNVTVLSLSVNQLESLRDFAGCPSLEELYLRKNCVEDLAQVGFLQGLPRLRILWLCDNPAAKHPLYREFVIRMLPALVKLDNTDVTPSERAEIMDMRHPDLALLEDNAARLCRTAASGGGGGAGGGGSGAGAGPGVGGGVHPALRDGHGARPAECGPASANDAVLKAVMTLLPTLDASGLEAVYHASASLLASSAERR